MLTLIDRHKYMVEKTLFLLKPDAFDMSIRTIFANLDFYKQLKANNLSVIATSQFIMNYDMLIGYQPVLSPDFKSLMTQDWKNMTVDYQLNKKHMLVIVEGYNALSKGPKIKRYLRDNYCSPWDKYAPTNIIHAPDNNEEYHQDLRSFEPILKNLNVIRTIEQLYNKKREK